MTQQLGHAQVVWEARVCNFLLHSQYTYKRDRGLAGHTPDGAPAWAVHCVRHNGHRRLASSVPLEWIVAAFDMFAPIARRVYFEVYDFLLGCVAGLTHNGSRRPPLRFSLSILLLNILVVRHGIVARRLPPMFGGSIRLRPYLMAVPEAVCERHSGRLPTPIPGTKKIAW